MESWTSLPLVRSRFRDAGEMMIFSGRPVSGGACGSYQGTVAIMNFWFVLAGMLLALPRVGLGGSGPASIVPDDPRLQAVRADLQQVIDKAAKDGIPAALLLAKIHEGLAKGIAPERIRLVVDQLERGLVQSRSLIASRRSGPPDVALIQAVMEAQMAGIPFASIDLLLSGDTKVMDRSRAIEILTDLTLRGYPPARSAPLVRDLLVRDVPALPRLAASLETLRRESALTQAEAVDALSRGFAATGTLGDGLRSSVGEERRKIPGHGREDRPDREPPGRGAIPPGHDPARGRPPHPKKP